MAKKPAVKSTATKSTAVKKKTFEDSLPEEIKTALKRVKQRYYKEESMKEVVKYYKEVYEEIKKEFGKNNWNDRIYHKRAISKFKNQKKREKIGGAVDSYYGVIFGVSRTRDLTQRMRNDIAKVWTDNPQKAINEGLIMTREDPNPMTGAIERIPIIDKDGSIIPRDNREFFTRKDGTKFKNANFGMAIGHSYRKTAIGVCSNMQGIKGAFLMELADKATDLEIPTNCLTKFTARTRKSDVVKTKGNNYINKILLENMIEDLKDDVEQEIIEKERADQLETYYKQIHLDEEKEIYFFNLRSSKGTSFALCESEKDFEKAEFPRLDSGIDVNILYKEYMYPFTSDCSSLLNYHLANQYLDEKKEEVNWDEFVSLQDVNVVQMNMEASLSGNITMHVDDESLSITEINHNDNIIDTVVLLIPTHIKINFGQDSRLNIIGSPFQFQEQDEDRKLIFDEIEVNGKIEKIPVMQYPTIMVYGVYPIPEYMVEVETMDLTFDEEINVEELINGKDDEKEEKTEAVEDIEEDLEDELVDEEDLEDLEDIEESHEEDIW